MISPRVIEKIEGINVLETLIFESSSSNIIVSVTTKKENSFINIKTGGTPEEAKKLADDLNSEIRKIIEEYINKAKKEIISELS